MDHSQYIIIIYNYHFEGKIKIDEIITTRDTTTTKKHLNRLGNTGHIEGKMKIETYNYCHGQKQRKIPCTILLPPLWFERQRSRDLIVVCIGTIWTTRTTGIMWMYVNMMMIFLEVMDPSDKRVQSWVKAFNRNLL